MKSLLIMDLKSTILSSWKIFLSYLILLFIISLVLIGFKSSQEEFIGAILPTKLNFYQNPIITTAYFLTNFLFLFSVLKIFFCGIERAGENILLRLERKKILVLKVLEIGLVLFLFSVLLSLFLVLFLHNYYKIDNIHILKLKLFFRYYFFFFTTQIFYLLGYIISRIYKPAILVFSIIVIVYLTYFSSKIEIQNMSLILLGIFLLIEILILTVLYQKKFVQIYEKINGGIL